MGRGRLEAFSDGVIAIIITIIVLELKTPHQATVRDLAAQAPVFLSYALSFLVVAIMWVNHHHLMHAVPAVDAPFLWWNNALLFAVSLIPFSTAFLGENPRSPLAVSVYGANLALAGFGFFLLRGAAARRADRRTRRGAGSSSARISLPPASTRAPFRSPMSPSGSPSGSTWIYLSIPALYFMPERKIERAA